MTLFEVNRPGIVDAATGRPAWQMQEAPSPEKAAEDYVETFAKEPCSVRVREWQSRRDHGLFAVEYPLARAEQEKPDRLVLGAMDRADEAHKVEQEGRPDRLQEAMGE